MNWFILFFSLVTSISKSWSSMPKGIDWNTEGVEIAIKEASLKHKPIFLYWGAVWCPPCNQMKKTVFETQDFKKIIKKYIAVYLDGDTNEAQLWADKLKTKGYPTMIVLTEMGQEVFRFPTGIRPQEYIELLETLSQNLQNISEIVKKPIEKLSTIEWNILAAHSWAQDDSTLEDKKIFFQNYFEKIPASNTLAKSRLFFYFMEQVLENELVISNKENYQNYFKLLIKDDQLLLNNASYVSSYGKQIFEFLFTKEEINNIAPNFIDKLWMLTESKTITLDDRLSLYVPIIELEKTVKGDVSQITKNKITQISLKTAKESKGEFERQALVDRAITLLIKIQNFKEAKKIALKEIKISKSPFYFMSDLALIAKEEKNEREALDWSYKAWKKSTGKNTRFRWGTSYISYLLEFDSKNIKQISQDLSFILSEALTNSEAFMGANKLRFSKIKNKIETWKKDHENDFTKLKNDIRSLCPKANDQKQCINWAETL